MSFCDIINTPNTTIKMVGNYYIRKLTFDSAQFDR